jgi:PAS domain S-box-containing protein
VAHAFLPESKRLGWEEQEMKDERKTKKQLIGELSGLRLRVTELEGSEAIPRSSEFYTAILDNVLDGVWATDKDDVIYYANRRMGEIAGTGTDAFIGARVLIDFPEETLRYLRPFYYKARDTMMPVDYSAVPVITPASHNTFLSGRLIPMEAEGRFDGMICTVVDVAKQKQAEDENRRQHRMMQNTVESLTHPFYVIDAHNYTIEFANSASGVKGCQEGQTCYALTHGIDRPCQDEDLVCPLEEVKRTGLPSVVEHTFSDGEGNAKICDVSCYPIFDEDGNVAQVIAYHIDITQRKQAEDALRKTAVERERLKAIINRSRAMVFLWRLQDGWPVEYVSDNVKEVLGYTAEDLISGRISWPGITHPDDLLELEAEVEKYLEEGVDEFTQEYRVTSKAGEIRWIRDRNKVLRDSDGAATHMQSILTDITRYMLAEKELRDMHNIVNMSSVVAYMCRANKDWTTEFISENVREVLGYSPEDFYSGKVRYSEIVHPDDFSRVLAEYEKLVQDGEPDGIEIEYRLKTGSGEEVWIEDSAWAIRDANGEIAYIQGVDVDITTRKQVEVALRDSEEKYRRLFETETDAIMIFDAQTRQFVDVNESAVRLYGYSRGEFLSMRHNDITTEPDDSEFSIEQTLAGEVSRIPIRFHEKKDGTIFPVEISASSFKLKGRSVLCGVIRDITERKRAEQALKESEEILRLVLESAEDLIFMQDLKGKYLFCNGAQRYGFQASDLIGKTPFDFHDQAAAKKIVDRVKKVAASGESLVSENRVDWNGEQLRFRDQVSPVTDADGHVIAVVTISHNIA